MNPNSFVALRTGQAIPRGQIPQASFEDFRQTVVIEIRHRFVAAGFRINRVNQFGRHKISAAAEPT